MYLSVILNSGIQPRTKRQLPRRSVILGSTFRFKLLTSSDSLLNGLDPAEVPYRLPSQTTKDSKLHKTSQAMGKRLSFERRSNTADQRSRTMEQVDKANRAKDLDKLQTRRWKQGDVYAPHDLTPAEMKKWKMRKKSSVDAFDILAINPVDQWKVIVRCTEPLAAQSMS